jgi:tRNA pseudouridine55 synthase
VVDKPEGMTSFAVVDKAKRWFRLKKVGHCGTLDPFATGVIVLCINQATRIADQLSGQDKVYHFTLLLGVETETLDTTGKVVRTYSGPPRTEEELKEALNPFQGSYLQGVPRHAAVKVQGRRLYEWTRRGIEVDLPKREVHVHRLDLLAYRWPEAQLEVHCSKGTYIRQLASDLGHFLQCGAHVSQLRRLASGPFSLHQAVSMEELRALRTGDRWHERLISFGDALDHLPAIVIEEKEVIRKLRNGYLDPAWEAKHGNDFSEWEEPIRLITDCNHLLALWWRKSEFQNAYSEHSGKGQRRLRVFC